MDIEFKEMVISILGLKCEHVARYFGTMFMMDFGKKSKYISKIGDKEMDRWEWFIDIKDCEWWIESRGESIVGNGDSETKISEKIQIFKDKSIRGIEIYDEYSAGKFEFEDETFLYTRTKPNARYEDWDIKTPEGKYLLVGPKHKWVAVSGDETFEW